MAANLVMKGGVALMFSVGKSWHGQGHTLTSPPTPEEALKMSGMDREVYAVDCYAEIPDGHGGSRKVSLPDRRVSVDSEGRYLGTVGGSFSYLQGHEIMSALTPWLEFADIHSGGLLDGGRKEWLQLELKNSEREIVKGDPVRSYLMVAQGHDMTMGLVSGYTGMRIVCKNTLHASLREGGLIKVKHRGDMVTKITDVQEKLLAIREAEAHRDEIYKFLASKNVTQAKFNAFLEGIGFAVPGKKVRAGSPADRIRNAFEEGIGNKPVSFWHMFNAVTEDNTHFLGNALSNDTNGVGDQIGRALERSLLGGGSRLIDLAFNVAVNLASDRAADAKVDLGAIAA